MKKLIIMLLLLAILNVCLVSCGKDKEVVGEVSDISLISEESEQGSITDETSEESIAQNSPDDNSDISSDDSSEEVIESEAEASRTEESKTDISKAEDSKPEESKPEESKAESSTSEESSNAEESSEAEDRKLKDMTAAELLNYAYIENAMLDSFTATTSNEMKFTYAGQSGSYKYSSVTKAEGLNGQSPKYSCQSVTSLDESENKLTERYTNGYLYRDKGTDKYKTVLSTSQIKGRLTENIGAANKLSGNVFKTVKKSATENGLWLVTGTGLTSSSMNGIIDSLLSSFDLGATTSDIKLDTFCVDTYINSDGCITLQNVSFIFTMDLSGITLKFNTVMKTEYSALGSTKVDMTVNPGDYTETK
ncbi:MAG: hypothetical protein EOM87_04420 [Clostridia bacterium]|nr:hypothetical protein [Clostridia bacterium]